MKNFLSISQFSKEEIINILKDAKSIRTALKGQGQFSELKNKNILSLFYELSTRTQISFELASKNLSANYSQINKKYTSLMKGESTLDMMKTFESMNTHFLIIRHPTSGFCYWLAEQNFSFSIINAGNGIQEHPSQALIDLLTIQDYVPLSKNNLKILFWGDVLHSRVFKSLLLLLNKFNFKISIFAPPTLIPEWLIKNFKNCTIETNPKTALKNTHFIYPLRMQCEKYLESNFFKLRKELFKMSYYTLSKKYLKYIPNHAIILHAGPVNENIEISKSLVINKKSKILKQVENGMPIRMAILNFIHQKNNIL